MNPTLSKSDFQLASACPKKLIYKKSFYPTTNDTNEYMEMLALGGYIIGKMATYYHPTGIEIEGNTKDCINKTQELLQNENIILFEPAIQSNDKLVRIDILVKEGKRLHLIEVKAKSFDSTDEKKKKELAKYVDDVAYQYLVLSEAYPDYEISCSLFMPDKSRRTKIDNLSSWFNIVKGKQNDNENEAIITQAKPIFRKPTVVFKYENHPQREDFVKQLINDGILALLDVTAEVKALQPIISQQAISFLRMIKEGIKQDEYRIGKTCKGCEFNAPEASKNGYYECWGKLSEPDPHVFDLYYGGAKKAESKEFLIDELIWAGKTSLYDFDIELLLDKNGEAGSRAHRQLIQIENTRNNSEWISPELKTVFQEFQYPLHFIDFETYTGAIPFHKGMRPYELIAFQWSCHTIQSKGATPVHSEWIHMGKQLPDPTVFPNFEFARTLMNQIGNTGTPLMWATHENTVLRTVLNQMTEFGYKDDKLESWLIEMTKDEGRDGRWVDMNKLTLQHYFHPYMKGRTSIKKVLPAIWGHYPKLHEIPHFKNYAPEKLESGIADPYDTLIAGIGITENDNEVVKGGTDAMRAYQRLSNEEMSIDHREEIIRQLLEYCKLDTMAMVIIAHHWGLR